MNLSSILGGGLILKRQLITTNTTFNRPPRMAGDTVFVTGIGGGASGRSSNASAASVVGGDGGQYVIQTPVDIGAATSVNCVIGQGGVSSALNAAPNHGTPTSFGAFLTLLGGVNRATSGSPTPVGAPGGRGDSVSTMNGADTPLGYGGRLITNVATSKAAGGGGLVLDASLVSGGVNGSSVTPAQGYGAGGNAENVIASGQGAPGVLLVEWMEFA